VRYARGALLTYQLHAHSPWEGYHIAFNGTRGRIEHRACETTYVSGDGTVPGELTRGNVSITHIPEFAQPRAIEPRTGSGGHGGGDPILLADIFDPNAPDDPLGRKAFAVDGAHSVLIGAGACTSIDTGAPVRIAELPDGAPVDAPVDGR
ncbi:MAG: gfo/Idh/MocA family oxidoreductase, partial [Planctomycetota bacterium]